MSSIFLSLLSTVASLALKAWGYFSAKKHDDEVIKTTRAVDGEQNAAAALNEVQMAKEARDNVTSDLSNHPERLRESDGFNRGHTSSSDDNSTVH